MDGVKFLPSFLREIYPPRTIRASRFLYSNISVTKYTNEKTSSGCLFWNIYMLLLLHAIEMSLMSAATVTEKNLLLSTPGGADAYWNSL